MLGGLVGVLTWTATGAPSAGGIESGHNTQRYNCKLLFKPAGPCSYTPRAVSLWTREPAHIDTHTHNKLRFHVLHRRRRPYMYEQHWFCFLAVL